MLYGNNKDADQLVQVRSLMSIFVVRCFDSIIPILAKSKNSRLAGLSSSSGHFESHQVANPKDRFSRDVAHMVQSHSLKPSCNRLH